METRGHCDNELLSAAPFSFLTPGRIEFGRGARLKVAQIACDLNKAIAVVLPGAGDVMDHLEGVGYAHPLLCDPLPFDAVPTTSGTGAEVTKNAVITVPEAGRKVSLRDDRMLPDVAIIDPALTDGAPRGQTLASGLDALTQVLNLMFRTGLTR